jgi:dolichol-phosphate mannosyltransferase
MHFFGTLGLVGTSLGGLIMLWLLIHKLGGDPIMQHGPLLIAGGLLLLGGLMMFSTGLIGEVMIRTYFESQGRRIYAVREIRTRQARSIPGKPHSSAL